MPVVFQNRCFDFVDICFTDENKKVEDQCDKVLSIIRQNFGKEIADDYV